MNSLLKIYTSLLIVLFACPVLAQTNWLSGNQIESMNQDMRARDAAQAKRVDQLKKSGALTDAVPTERGVSASAGEELNVGKNNLKPDANSTRAKIERLEDELRQRRNRLEETRNKIASIDEELRQNDVEWEARLRKACGSNTYCLQSALAEKRRLQALHD